MTDLQTEIKVLKHGYVYLSITGYSLDYGAPDPNVNDQLTPEEAIALGAELVNAGIQAKRMAL